MNIHLIPTGRWKRLGFVKGTEGKFECASGINLGELIFEEYTTDVDANSREAIHSSQGEPLVCKGHAFINNQATNVIVFRAKP
ncbi:MAG TPA: hypothetical protein VIX17_15605 [Pyrinomonadaceae bacterium]